MCGYNNFGYFMKTNSTVTGLNTFQLSFNTCPFSTTFLIPLKIVLQRYGSGHYLLLLRRRLSVDYQRCEVGSKEDEEKKHPRHTVTSAQSLNHSLLCQTRRAALSL